MLQIKISDSSTQQLKQSEGSLITGAISSYTHFFENSFWGKTNKKQKFSLPSVA
jgi:hypothetical protein